MATDPHIDTLEVLLNPGLIKTKLSALSRDVAYVQGTRLLQDLLSITRFGTPEIVPAETTGNRKTSDDIGAPQQQAMTLTERQDMLLGQACRVYYFATLSLDDIFNKVPQPNQLCLITAMMLLTQNPNADVESQAEPWDPLTLFQRWILRSRVAGAEDSGLELGESQFHAEALEIKLAALEKLSENVDNQILECQISSELGQFYCWSGQYKRAIAYLEQCQKIHHQHSLAVRDGPSKCHLDEGRAVALANLSRLATLEPLDTQEKDILSKLQRLEQDKDYWQLTQGLLDDNITRSLPYSWRQSVLVRAAHQSDMIGGSFIAVANALYYVGDPTTMMLEIPSKILQNLRNIRFEGRHEVDVFLSPSVFQRIMEIIQTAQDKERTSGNRGIGAASKEAVRLGHSRNKFKTFVEKFCASVGHVLCYHAAWEIGLLEPSQDTWSHVWDTYSLILTKDLPFTMDLLDSALHTAPATAAESRAFLLKLSDADGVDRYISEADVPPLARALIALALGAFACRKSSFLEGNHFFRMAGKFLMQEPDQTSMTFGQVEFQLRKHISWSQLGLLVVEHEDRREQRIEAKIRQKISMKRADGNNIKVDSVATDSNMDIDHADQNIKAQDQKLREAQTMDDEDCALKVCQLLPVFLANFGALEAQLQLRCLAICINGRQWDFLSTYGRAAADALDKSIHGEICQVYSVLVPLCAVLGRSQVLGVDLRDTMTASCLDALFSSDLDPINITRMAACDMIQGLLPSIIHLANIGSSGNINDGAGGYHPSSIQQRGNGGKFDQDGLFQDEDAGHTAILKLFSWVRLRGVVDIFGALLAGTVTSILPEGSKLTLSEFGYYALFTTTMDSVGSWMDPRVKIIAMLSNGDAGKAVELVPGACQRLVKLLLQVYESQVRHGSEAQMKRKAIESRLLAMDQCNIDLEITSTKIGSALFSSSSLSSSSSTLSARSSHAQTIRYLLCLTDLYHLEGMHQDALASFLHASMVASKCFSDLDWLDRRVWAAYTHEPSSLASSLSPHVPQTTVLSQVGPIPGVLGLPGEQSPIAPMYPTLTALASMAGGSGQSFMAGGTIGLGLSPSSPMPEGSGGLVPTSHQLSGQLGAGHTFISPAAPPGPMSMPPATAGVAGAPLAIPHMGPGSVLGPLPLPPAFPSSFAIRAIDSCLQLKEPLSSAALQQFLPRTDYNQALAAVRLAHEQGMLTFSGKAAFASFPGLQTPVTPSSAAASGATIPTPTPPTNPGPFNGGSGLRVSVPAATSPRVLPSSLIFTPPGNGSGFGHGLPNVARLWSGGSSLSPQLFLDLTYDVTLLELASYLCKVNKDQLGLLKVQARINSNRMALDARQSFRDQVHRLAQQDLLSHMWSKHARIG